ncbi:MAG: hypothetical protein KI791_06915 [Cyclobacteriaceae bacterium]|nr:hypothetical protein [Cyclobacteriaceae bacterium SS2]
MNKSFSSAFFYSFYARYVGFVLIVLGTIIFIHRIVSYDIIDVAGFSFPVAIGLIFIFFSRERNFDERLVYLKFKSLAISIPIITALTSVINYFHNFSGYSIDTDSWYSISAFEYLSSVLILALCLFHFYKWNV